jgi:hypothetical protein
VPTPLSKCGAGFFRITLWARLQLALSFFFGRGGPSTGGSDLM